MNLQTQHQNGADAAPVTRPSPVRPAYVPRADIHETADAFIVIADVPGADEQSVDVTFDRDVLTIEARPRDATPTGHSLAHREFRTGDYRRQFTVTADIDRERIDATLRDGVLRVSLPKATRAKAHKVVVKATS